VARSFRLESVLNHRRYKEETARKVFADAVRELSRQQRRLAAMETTRTQYQRALRRKQENGGTVAEILLYTRYLTRLDAEIRSQQKIIATKARDKEKKRQALMTTLKDRKVIEKLKEHYQSDLEAEERRAEQKLLNEAAISRYQRGK
jgi:flagellar FliJ protein